MEERNTRVFVLPAVLILAAAFLATSLSTGGIDGNIDGAAVTGNNLYNCDWSSTERSDRAYCPAKHPNVVDGNCNNGNTGSVLFEGSQLGNGVARQGWRCDSSSEKIDVFCCN